MIDPIDTIIEATFAYNVDMLHHISLSMNASTIRYALAYKDFDPTKTYPSTNGKSTFKLTKKYWKIKVKGYINQDKKAGRDPSHNVTMDDLKYYKDQILKSKCSVCGESFTEQNKPTLDRIDNSLPHTKENTQLACCDCNTVKANHDEQEMTMLINLRKYCISKQLPMTLDSEDAYHILRDGITGGLSNVQHRLNIKGITKINKLKYDPVTNTVPNYEQETS